MRGRLRKNILLTMLTLGIPLFGQDPTEPNRYGPITYEVTNSAARNHPVKSVFKKHKLKLIKVEFYKYGQYTVYFIEFPWDTMSGMNNRLLSRIEAEIFLANGRHSYAITDLRNKVRIEMTDKSHGKHPPILEENIIILEGGEVF